MTTGIFIFPTLACNLRCPDCYENGHDRSNTTMTQATWQHICERLRLTEERYRECVFTGGEPTLWPYLAQATRDAKVFADRVRVLSNGYRALPGTYGDADIIQLSDYGGINRLDLLRLRQALGRRVRIQLPVHFAWTNKTLPVSESLPAVCSCAGWSFAAGRVYPCAVAAGTLQGPSYSLDNFERACVDDPQRRPMCQSCPVNRKVRRHYMPRHRYVQAGVWEGPGRLWQLPQAAEGIMRWWRRRMEAPR